MKASQRNRQRDYSDLEDDDDQMDRRSELMKRGRVVRSYYREESEVVNNNLRSELDDLVAPQEDMDDYEMQKSTVIRKSP